MKYALKKGALAEREYQDEYRWSLKQWGRVHADAFFERVDEVISSLAFHPFAYPKPIGTKGDYRVINLGGLRIAYHVGEGNALVTILAIVGRKHYHELEDKVIQALKKLHE